MFKGLDKKYGSKKVLLDEKPENLFQGLTRRTTLDDNGHSSALESYTNRNPSLLKMGKRKKDTNSKLSIQPRDEFRDTFRNHLTNNKLKNRFKT